jgi:hypothetical protein
MLKRPALLVGLLIALSQTPRAHAADDPNVQRLAEYIKSPVHLEAVEAAIKAFEPNVLAATCKDVKPVKGRSWKPIEEPQFDTYAAAPKSAAWQESWDVSACGKPGIRNLGFVARPGQGVVPLPMFPGQSLADLKVQESAGQMALDTFAPGALGCKEGQIQVIDSEIVDRTELARDVWSERWIAAGCGRTVPIDVFFSPGSDGRPQYGFRAGIAH